MGISADICIDIYTLLATPPPPLMPMVGLAPPVGVGVGVVMVGLAGWLRSLAAWHGWAGWQAGLGWLRGLVPYHWGGVPPARGSGPEHLKKT